MAGSVINVRSAPKARARWRNTAAAEYRADNNGKSRVVWHKVPEGKVKVWADADTGRLFVGIGRKGGTKYWNVSAEEAALISGALAEALA